MRVVDWPVAFTKIQQITLKFLGSHNLTFLRGSVLQTFAVSRSALKAFAESRFSPRLWKSESLEIGGHLRVDFSLRMMIILESDAGILGKKKSEFSDQESNLRPSDY